MADLPKLSSDPHPDPAAPAPAPARGHRRPPLAAVGILLAVALNLALCLRRAGHDRGALGFLALSHVNLILLFLSLRRFERSPPGSVARDRARLVVWLLTTTLTAVFTWKVAALMPLGFAIAAWAVAAATVLGGFYMLFLLHGEK